MQMAMNSHGPWSNDWAGDQAAIKFSLEIPLNISRSFAPSSVISSSSRLLLLLVYFCFKYPLRSSSSLSGKTTITSVSLVLASVANKVRGFH